VKESSIALFHTYNWFARTVGALSIAFFILVFLFALREAGSMRTGFIFSTSSLRTRDAM
jgi:hypothetical protein